MQTGEGTVAETGDFQWPEFWQSSLSEVQGNKAPTLLISPNHSEERGEILLCTRPADTTPVSMLTRREEDFIESYRQAVAAEGRRTGFFCFFCFLFFFLG